MRIQYPVMLTFTPEAATLPVAVARTTRPNNSTLSRCSVTRLRSRGVKVSGNGGEGTTVKLQGAKNVEVDGKAFEGEQGTVAY